MLCVHPPTAVQQWRAAPVKGKYYGSTSACAETKGRRSSALVKQRLGAGKVRIVGLTSPSLTNDSRAGRLSNAEASRAVSNASLRPPATPRRHRARPVRGMRDRVRRCRTTRPSVGGYRHLPQSRRARQPPYPTTTLATSALEGNTPHRSSLSAPTWDR